MAAAAKLLKPTKGIKPHTDGVPGELIKASDMPQDIIFGSKLRMSPYDIKLKLLLDAGTESVLCFGDVRARASVYSRAKKLGMKIEYGEHAGKLYVRLAASSTAQRPAVTEPTLRELVASDHKIRNRAAILSAIRAGKRSPEAIAAWMRTEDPNCHLDAPIVRSMLKPMQAAGSVILKTISPETWEIGAGLA